MQHLKMAMSLILVAPVGVPQTMPAGKGALSGTAFDSRKHFEAGVKVYIQRDDQEQVITAETNSEGKYRMVITSGHYHLRAEGPDGLKVATSSVNIEDGKVTEVDLVLQQSLEAEEPQFYDEPKFTIAGVKDNTYRGGHGSDSVLRSSEDLMKATAALSLEAKKAHDAEPHHALAEAYERDGRSVDAAKEFQIAAELNPTERNLFDWGTDLLSHRAPAAAIEVYSKGCGLFPQSAQMLLGLATAYYAEDKYAQAADWFFRATDLNPGDEIPYQFLGKVKAPEIIEMHGYEERMARFAHLHPNNALANYYYGLTLENRGQKIGDETILAQARKLFAQCEVLDPHFASAHLQSGVIYARENRYSEAIRSYQRAIADDPSFEEAHYRLSEAFRVLGKKAEAEAELKTYRQLAKMSAESREKQRQTIQQFVLDLQNTRK